jgi:hypothetical protein
LGKRLKCKPGQADLERAQAGSLWLGNSIVALNDGMFNLSIKTEAHLTNQGANA